ncbi:hypothetical protein ACH4KV_24055 [Streptomyces albidoflavus]
MSEMSEPIYCGRCLYGSDIGVPGYDDKGPAYTNPECPYHNPAAYEAGESK